jgi:hypothetical protein
MFTFGHVAAACIAAITLYRGSILATGDMVQDHLRWTQNVPSIDRVAAGAFGFLIFSQTFDARLIRRVEPWGQNVCCGLSAWSGGNRLKECMVFPSYRTVFTIKMRPSTITIIVNSMLLAPKPIVGISDITISVITPAASITARIMNIALNANESLLIPLRPYRQFGATRARLSTIRG